MQMGSVHSLNSLLYNLKFWGGQESHKLLPFSIFFSPSFIGPVGVLLSQMDGIFAFTQWYLNLSDHILNWANLFDLPNLT